jgi:ABC-type Zn uptake system ZnuABC Zn-binding protein ZnuA
LEQFKESGESLKRRRAIAILAVTAMLSLILSEIASSLVNAQAQRVLVVTTLPVLDYLVKMIGGKYVSAISLVPQGANPHTYEPSTKDLEKAMKADVIVASGLHHTRLEEIIEEYIKEGKITGIYLDVNTYKLYGLKLIQVNGRPSPHGFWWDPSDLAAMALAIGDALSRKDPYHANYYKARAEEIADKSLTLRTSLEGLRVAVYSPPDEYFAKGCGAKVVLLLAPSPGSAPTPDKLQELLSLKSSIDVLIISYVDLSMSKTAGEVAERFVKEGGKVAIIPLGAPSWDPLSSIIAGVWSVLQQTSKAQTASMESCSALRSLNYSDVGLVLIVGVSIGMGAMIAWTRRVCG